ncbi:MAG: MFS transporter [Pseudomonadota bacterium]
MIILIFLAFISLGLPDGLLGVAWPGIRQSFELPLDAIGPLLVAGTAGYMTSSVLIGPLMRRLGTGGLLVTSIALTAAMLGVYATTPAWILFVLAAGLSGLGAGAIDAGVNIYVATHYGARAMQWLHACFGVGVTTGPLIMTAALAETGRWQVGYLVVCGLQFVLAAVFFTTRNAWRNSRAARGGEANLAASVRHFPSVLSALLFFLYTGIEAGIGLWIFTLLTESRGVDTETAGIVTAAYWGTFTLGRILAGLTAHHVASRILIQTSLAGALCGCGLLAANLGQWIDITGVMLIGFAIAPVFPALTTDTAARVGARHERNTIGLQMSAAGFGAALMPATAGVVAGQFGLEMIPVFFALSSLLLLTAYVSTGQRDGGQ